MFLLAFHIVAISMLSLIVGALTYNFGVKEGARRAKRAFLREAAEEEALKATG